MTATVEDYGYAFISNVEEIVEARVKLEFIGSLQRKMKVLATRGNLHSHL